MLDFILSLFENRTFGALRSSEWSRASKAHRVEQPLCEFGMHNPTMLNPLNTHHIKDFSTYPELEMEKSNWINLCRFHHLYHAHLGAWRSICPTVREDARIYTEMVKNRRK